MGYQTWNSGVTQSAPKLCRMAFCPRPMSTRRRSFAFLESLNKFSGELQAAAISPHCKTSQEPYPHRLYKRPARWKCFGHMCLTRFVVHAHRSATSISFVGLGLQEICGAPVAISSGTSPRASACPNFRYPIQFPTSNQCQNQCHQPLPKNLFDRVFEICI